ncbi:alkaline phosphatase family protein [Bacillus alkalicellulosilyticus]|uniref:alkaline phosphatase family protein n=1 Tax=Alkalihalobacterium alkalicellulosilyticum TaxID=1912214 RepID=UPI000996F9A7|nr:alkaline phosphatase family protein [Bacillus alkalicellulosilyticus]
MSTSKLAFIMIDGLRYDTAVSHMGYLHHLVENQKASRFKVKSELPAMSRPLYEVLLTGTPPYINGVTNNQVVRLSTQESLFHLTKKHSLRNAVAAYYWVSELYNQAPFSMVTDRIQENENRPIQYGMFYWEDHYPDSHLFSDAHYLLSQHNPDFLYVHSMNVDDSGHKFTADSKEYRNRVIAVDVILSTVVPKWIEAGYQLIITADHGMTEDGMHGGNSKADREVPLFVISDKTEPLVHEQEISQLQLAPLACKLLDIPPSPAMQELQWNVFCK